MREGSGEILRYAASDGSESVPACAGMTWATGPRDSPGKRRFWNRSVSLCLQVVSMTFATAGALLE